MCVYVLAPEWMCVNHVHAATLEGQQSHQISVELKLESGVGYHVGA